MRASVFVTAPQGHGHPDKRDLDILPRSFANEEHRQNRGRRHRFFHELNHAWKRLLKGPAVEQDLSVIRAEDGGRLGRIGEFVIRKDVAIANRERPP